MILHCVIPIYFSYFLNILLVVQIKVSYCKFGKCKIGTKTKQQEDIISRNAAINLIHSTTYLQTRNI